MHPAEYFGRLVVRKRHWGLGLILFITLFSLYAIGDRLKEGLPVDFTPQAIFFDDGPALARLHEIENDFGREDNDLIFLLHGSGLATSEGYQTIEAIHKTLEKSSMVESVDSLVTAKTITEGTLDIRPIWEETEESRLNLALSQAPYPQFLVALDGNTTAVRARLPKGLEKVHELKPVVAELVTQVSAIPLSSNLELHITGVPFVRTEVIDMMMADEIFFIPILAIIFGISICVLFRKIAVGLAPLVAVLFAILWGMGLLLGFGVTLNVLSILVPTLALVIGVADGIHIISRYREELIIDQNTELALGRCMRHMVLACFLTTFTTAAGFCSLLVADTTVVRDFGIHAAVMVMVAFVAIILVVPVWLAYIPKERVGSPSKKESREHRLFLGLDKWVRLHPRKITVFSLLFSIGAGLYGAGVTPNSHLLEMYSDSHPTAKAIHLMETELSGVVPIFIHFQAKSEDLLKPDIVSKMDSLEQALKKHSLVLWTHSFSGQIKEIHRLLSGSTDIPVQREVIAQELLLAEVSGELPLDSIRSIDYTQARILALCSDAGGDKFIEMSEDIQSEIDVLFPSHDPVQVSLTGDGLMASIGINNLISDLLSSLSLIFVLILVILYALLKDWKLTIISTLPNAIPLLFTLGCLAFIGADLQTSNIISFTVAVGLAVDDTIHFVVRYHQEIQKGNTHERAITNTMLGAGHAIVLTSILLIVGFGTLASSDLTTTAHFGLLSSVTLLAAVGADLLMLPAMLHIVQSKDNAAAR